MAKAILVIEDRKEGPGVIYKLELDPKPVSYDNVTMAQQMGLTSFDAIEATLKQFGAKIQPAGEKQDAQT